MKKLFAMLAVAAFVVSANAQDYEVPFKKTVVTNSFWSNWYVSAGGDFNAAYTSQQNLGNKNPFSVDRGTFGFDFSLGKWVTPGVGFRTNLEIGWAKRVNTAHDHHAYAQWNLHEDVTFNVSNLIWGYNEKRVWNFIPYVGIGLVRNMSDNNYDISLNAGLLNNFRINRHFSVFADLYVNAKEGSFDGAENDNWAEVRKMKSKHWDKLVGLSLGVTYNFGKANWQKAPDVDALIAMNQEQMNALNASLKDQQDENARLRDLLKNQKPTAPAVTEKVQLVSTSQSVFFNIGKSKIASRKDLVNVKEVAEYAKANDCKIIVTGYADSKTGSAEYNQRLSENRANVVAEELVKMGVNRDNIIVEGKGGVDVIAPFSYNRRVTVKIQ